MTILFILLSLISFKLTLVVLFIIPIGAFFIIKISQSIRRKAMRASYKIADISNLVSEKIIGIKIIKTFNMTKDEINNFVNHNLAFFTIFFGIYPEPLLNTVDVSIDNLINKYKVELNFNVAQNNN